MTKLPWPTVDFFHIIDLPFLLLEQAGLIFKSSPGMLFCFQAVSQSIFLNSNNFFSIWASVKLKWLILFLTVIILVLASLPYNALAMSKIVNYLNPLANILVFTQPVLTWIVAKIRFFKASEGGGS